MKFVDAIKNQETRTTNGMKARVSSANACVDLFYNIGASRGKNIVPAFTAAFVENSDLALRIAQWARDVRGAPVNVNCSVTSYVIWKRLLQKMLCV